MSFSILECAEHHSTCYKWARRRSRIFVLCGAATDALLYPVGLILHESDIERPLVCVEPRVLDRQHPGD